MLLRCLFQSKADRDTRKYHTTPVSVSDVIEHHEATGFVSTEANPRAPTTNTPPPRVTTPSRHVTQNITMGIKTRARTHHHTWTASETGSSLIDLTREGSAEQLRRSAGRLRKTRTRHSQAGSFQNQLFVRASTKDTKETDLERKKKYFFSRHQSKTKQKWVVGSTATF